MIKLLLRHTAALAAAVVFGAIFAIVVIEALLPPVGPGFVPREVAVGIYAAWIAGGTYLIFNGLHRESNFPAINLSVPSP